jgi:hypothetical protein
MPIPPPPVIGGGRNDKLVGNTPLIFTGERSRAEEFITQWQLYHPSSFPYHHHLLVLALVSTQICRATAWNTLQPLLCITVLTFRALPL